MCQFNNVELGCSVRVITINNEPWFVAKDVCDTLETRTDNLKSILEEDEICELANPYSVGVAQNGGRNPLIINESGLYSLILRSRKPEAKRFKKWVTSEVLPSIRGTGGYMTASPNESPDQIMARALLIAQDTITKVQQHANALENKVQTDAPKVLFADAVEASNSSILVGELAKYLRQNGIDIGRNRLFERLRKDGYLIRQKGENYNLPTQRAMDLGLFDLKKGSYINSSVSNIVTRTVTRTVKVTGKGQVYFVNKFLSQPQPVA